MCLLSFDCLKENTSIIVYSKIYSLLLTFQLIREKQKFIYIVPCQAQPCDFLSTVGKKESIFCYHNTE